MSKFCSNCGAALNEGARFCHVCGVAVGTVSAAPAAGGVNRLFWVPSVISLVAVVALVAVQFGSLPASGPDDDQRTVMAAPGRPPDISQMSPQEQADRLFDRVMRYASDGKTDSAAFFAPMAMGAIEALGPLDNHRRYDLGLIAVVSGDAAAARAQSDTILKSRPTHLLGLILAAKAAIARGDNAAAAALWQRLVAAEAKERAAGLPEYEGHANDLAAGLEQARKR